MPLRTYYPPVASVTKAHASKVVESVTALTLSPGCAGWPACKRSSTGQPKQ